MWKFKGNEIGDTFIRLFRRLPCRYVSRIAAGSRQRHKADAENGAEWCAEHIFVQFILCALAAPAHFR
jgi:hypothetical protein